MADEFKSYDKMPILSMLNIRKLSFGLRELILIGVSGVMLVMVLIFAGLYGNAASKLPYDASSHAEAIVGKST